MELIKNIATVVGCCISVITLLGIIIKPARKKIIDWIKHTSEATETSIAIQEMNKKLNVLEEKIDEIGKASKETDATLIERIDTLDERVEKLDKRVLENERDRIKAELSEYASRCARKMKIYPEDKLHVDEIYAKYTNELHCNSTGSEFYHEIVQYYEHQDWLKP